MAFDTGRLDDMIYAAHWRKQKIASSRSSLPEACLFVVPKAQRHTLKVAGELAGGRPILELEAAPTNDAVISFLRRSPDGRLIFLSNTKWQDGVDTGAISAFLGLMKALTAFRTIDFDIVTTRSVPCPSFTAVTSPIDAVYMGLGQTLAKEFPEWHVRCLSIDRLDVNSILSAVLADVSCAKGTPVCVSSGQYWTQSLRPALLPKVNEGGPGFKTGGTYVIIGANGGIGGILAEHIAKHYQGRLVLIGRRPVNHALVEKLNRLSGAVYEQVDLCDAQLLEQTLQKYPVIDGVVHSALVLQDASLMNMTEEALLSVLAPKVNGTVNLINALRYRDLDFVLFFSSIQSYIANAGQANYTAACVCKDALADLLRNALMVNSKVINWGFWGSVGIVAQDSYRERMSRLEIGSIEPEEGLEIIERFLGSSLPQIFVIKGSERALKRLNIEYPMTHANVLERIVPPYDAQSPEFARNRDSATALENYARSRMHELRLPSRVHPKFAKLAEALADIPYVPPMDQEEFLHQHSDLRGHVRLLEACLARYPEILSGKIDPLSVLFPGGSFGLVEAVYRDNPTADYFNKTVADVVDKFVGLRSGTKTRIMEIGAGTGSTTQFVLPLIKDANVEYIFTDLSFAFLNNARQRFAKYKFVEYRPYNAETEADFGPFDVVIASNVIHATTDLRNTLGNIRNALSDDGILILNEITSRKDFATLTFGLTDGWWLNADAQRIPNSPLVSGNVWRSLILGAGFSAIANHGSEDQQVIVAHAGRREIKTESAKGLYQTVSAEGVERWIREVLARVMHLEVDGIDRSAPFKDYGIDSLISMELINPFKDILGYLPATILFEYPSVAKLADYFMREHASALERYFGANKPDKPMTRSVENVATPVTPRGGVATFVRETVARVMRLDIDSIDDATAFREYGIDSIISLELLKPLKEVFGYLPTTLLFEYPSVKKLSDYLCEAHAEKAAALISTSSTIPAMEVVKTAPLPPGAPVRDEDIAIIGMAGRFPQAESCEEFWENLRAARDCTSQVPSSRWDVKKHHDPENSWSGGSYSKVGGFVANIDAFDNRFFNITPHDAELMDPQERLFAQVAYNAILHAGYSQAQLRGSETGVYIGVMNNAYSWYTPKHRSDAKPTSLFWSIANRLSYFFDWTGPSLAVDTACSASLTALHLACQGLKGGECKMGVVGGVNLIVHPRQYENLCRLHMLSETDQCKPFGAGADGFVDGEGICAIVVKRYGDAIRDCDRIYGVVRASAINAGGQANGYSAPNPDAQAALIRSAITKAGISPETISYVEAHGTGTELGDPIEIKGLTAAFREVSRQTVAIGSVKSNIGHLESAAGLAGVIKVLLQMEHRTLVPSIHCEQENPHLALDRTPFFINRELRDWRVGDSLARRASVSSFGAGGANAHVILEEFAVSSAQPCSQSDAHRYFVVFSAKSKLALQSLLDSFRTWLDDHTPDMEALSYTLCCCRDHFSHRVGFVVHDVDELKRRLEMDLQDCVSTKLPEADVAGLIAEMKAAKIPSVEAAETLIQLHNQGATIPWHQLFERRKVIGLPGYVFEKNRFWIDSEEASAGDRKTIVTHHNILSQELAPAAFQLSHLYQEKPFESIEDVSWRRILRSPDGLDIQWQNNGFSIRDSREPLVYCDGKITLKAPPDSTRKYYRQLSDARKISGAEIYKRFAEQGYRYGESYRCLQWAKVSRDIAKAFIIPGEDWGYELSPSLLDAGMQTAILLPPLKDPIAKDEVLVPCYLNQFVVRRLPKNEPIYAYCVRKHESEGRAKSHDIYFTDTDRNILMWISELMSFAVSKSILTETLNAGKMQTNGYETGRILAYELN